MKTKNLLVLGAIGVALYYLLKKDKVVSSQTPSQEGNEIDPNQTTPNTNTQPFTEKDLSGNDRSITLTEDVGMTKRMSRELIFKPPYRGGARPTQFMERTSGVWEVRGNFPNLPTTKVCRDVAIGDMMPVGMPFDDPRNCVMVADTQDVVKWIFSNDAKWKAKFGKKQAWFLDGKLPPMTKPMIDGKRKGMPIPMNRPFKTYTVRTI